MKYTVEGSIDFFAELYKSLDDVENEHKTDTDDNLCLISNQPLTDKFVELNCKHKFNYTPLYYDILNHKTKFNRMEGNNSTLRVTEIRCPYCRTVHDGVLPYYPELGFQKVNGVNFVDTTLVTKCYSSHGFSHGKCEFIMINGNTTIPCLNAYVTKLDNKTYCYYHVKMVNKENLQKIKDEKKKAKDEQKKMNLELKQKEKADKIKAKEELKKIVLEAKQKTKKPKNNTMLNIDGENVIISQPQPHPSTPNMGCTQIIKSGSNKGLPCGGVPFWAKITTPSAGEDVITEEQTVNECLCKRHYNLKHKSNITNVIII